MKETQITNEMIIINEMINDLQNAKWIHNDLIDYDKDDLIEKLKIRLNELEKA